MNIDQSKQIPLDGFLSRLGYVPSRRTGDQLWYLSPFRDEDTPSFKVNTGLNAWYDFGEGKGGDLIDFVTRLERLGNISGERSGNCILHCAATGVNGGAGVN